MCFLDNVSAMTREREILSFLYQGMSSVLTFVLRHTMVDGSPPFCLVAQLRFWDRNLTPASDIVRSNDGLMVIVSE